MTNQEVKTELLLAKGKHLLFKSRLRSYAFDQAVISEEILVNHLACDLGKWIEQSKDRFGTLPTLIHLDAVHQRVHSIARELVAEKKKGKDQEVSKKLKEAEIVFKDVIAGIEAMENDFMHL